MHGPYLQKHVHDYDSMIHSLYKICQREHETVEEYMLKVHKAVAVVKCAYPDQVPERGGRPEKRSLLLWTHPQSERHALSFAMADLPEREQADTSFNTLYHLAKKLEA